MPEDIKIQILKFFKENKEKSFSILEISEMLKLSWGTTSKYIEVLFAEGKITMEDRGNIKLVKYNGDKND